MDLEEYAMDKCPVPDLSTLTPKQCEAIESLWDELRDVEVDSLVKQLKSPDAFRRRLDEGLLEILGVSNSHDRRRIANAFEAGILAAINALSKTMSSETSDRDSSGE